MSIQTPDIVFGDLFKEVQMSGIFPDSKTFPDMVPKSHPDEILKSFQDWKSKGSKDLPAFVKKHFHPIKSYASGFKSEPGEGPVKHVQKLWAYLKREADEKVPGSSLLPLPFQYIVPGGRFGEIYYWDSYFTMLGLEESGEDEYIENMVDNFAFLIDQYGHIPNGNRSYFLSRSQPPFFAQMVELLADMRGKKVYKKYRKALKAEYKFWMSGGRLVTVEGFKLNRYWDESADARQESYKEDVELALSSKRDTAELNRAIRAACESGWDFSSRWLADGKNLDTIETTRIIPVDLQALLFGLERTLFFTSKKKKRKKALLRQMQSRVKFLDKFCWNEEKGVYEDFHLDKHSPTGRESLATVYPLFFNMCHRKRAKRIAKALKETYLKSGGLVTSPNNTGQQWDSPNGWAPLQYLAVQGLINYGHGELAKEIALRWIRLNESVFEREHKFVEKYNVVDPSDLAGGGEYALQDGFGWSNGVYLKLKAIFGEE